MQHGSDSNGRRGRCTAAEPQTLNVSSTMLALSSAENRRRRPRSRDHFQPANRGRLRLKHMVKRRHKPISDSGEEISTLAPRKAQKQGGATTPLPTYRYPARLSRPLQVRQESLPKILRAIAWKAQVRLCARYRRLMAAGKRQTLITTAIEREIAAFLWAIGQEVQPRFAA